MTKSFLQGKRNLAALIIWWLAWIFLQQYILKHAGITELIAVTDSYVTIILLFACCLLVINNMRYYLPKKEKYWYSIAVSLVLSLVWVMVLRWGLGFIFANNVPYIQLLKTTLLLRFAFGFLMIGCITLVSLNWYTQIDWMKTQAQQHSISELAKEAELSKLRQQLQPHFLFNSLNSISALTTVQPEKARQMIQQLSEFLRGTLRKEDNWNTLEEELSYIGLYLSIEQVRFGHRMFTEINTDSNALPLILPSMLLQPLVENAIKFGLYDTIGEVTIGIKATNRDGALIITIQNPYDASTAVTLPGTGFGLTAVKRRLWLLFGRNDLITIEKTDTEFITTLLIPQHKPNIIA
ncbi:MAG: sensor histidine kinase [Sphingobacteriales bacterium]|uniref:sensor histidine kinase n=1 Tax=Hydrotalea flava TaxID=714549 RepID=UPI0008331491|nr:histidine kinase [Hydrotalea flava]RTL48118.1 MAG: sensor histidine kinase [Sphingobacteriales bacterium]